MKIKLINPLLAKCNKLQLQVCKKFGVKVASFRKLNEEFIEKFKIAAVTSSDALNDEIRNFLKKESGFWPSRTASFKKVSKRAYEFVSALGKPDKSLISDFTEYINKLPDLYEEFIEIPNWKFLYLVKYLNVLIIFKFDSKLGQLHFTGVTLDQLDWHFNDYLKKSNDTEVDGITFIINLWMSAQNEVLISDNKLEPKESKSEHKEICDEFGYKSLDYAYRYIHITDTTWQKYSQAIKAVHEKKNFLYKLASWLVRAHWRKYNDKRVLVRAHFAYRKCSEVQEKDLIDLYV